MKDIQKDILLYWSGEADDTTMQRVRDRLEWDSEAQSYFNDLEAINTEFNAGKKNIACKISSRQKRILEEVISEAVHVEQPIILTKQSKPRWASLSFTATVAAAFTVLVAAYFLFIHTKKSNQGTTHIQLSSNHEEVNKFPHIDRIALSKRLLDPSVSFQKNGNGLISLRSNRERLKKIRTIKYKQ